MANIKWGLIAAIFALVISVILGIFSDVRISYIFLRALIFTVIFFGIGFSLRIMINNFFPEMLLSEDESESQEEQQAGSRINITLDSMGEYAVPELFKSHEGSDELGNIEDLISGSFGSYNKSYKAGIDRNREAGYNNFEVLQSMPEGEDLSSGISAFSSNNFSGSRNESDSEKAPVEQKISFQSFTPSLGDESGLGGLPDLDMMAMAFSASSGTPQAEGFTPTMPVTSAAFEDEPDQSHFSSGNKPQPLKGDFDAKGLAEGIRTVLSKDR